VWRRINRREKVETTETGEKYVRRCFICFNLQQNGGWWKGRERMCLAGGGIVMELIQNK
jgi:hypothetical protein